MENDLFKHIYIKVIFNGYAAGLPWGLHLRFTSISRSLETKGWLNHQGHLPFNNEHCF
jgi:hypothetical protein